MSEAHNKNGLAEYRNKRNVAIAFAILPPSRAALKTFQSLLMHKIMTQIDFCINFLSNQSD